MTIKKMIKKIKKKIENLRLNNIKKIIMMNKKIIMMNKIIIMMNKIIIKRNKKIMINNPIRKIIIKDTEKNKIFLLIIIIQIKLNKDYKIKHYLKVKY